MNRFFSKRSADWIAKSWVCDHKATLKRFFGVMPKERPTPNGRGGYQMSVSALGRAHLASTIERLRVSPLRGLLGTNLMILAIGGLGGVLAARLLQPAGRGSLVAAVAYATVVTGISGLGVSQAAIYHSAREATKGSSLRCAIRLAVPQAILADAVLVVVAVGIVRSPQAMQCLFWYLLWPPSALAAGAVLSWYQGRGEWRHYNLASLLVASVNLVPIVLLGMAGAATATRTAALNNVLMLLVAAFLLRRALSEAGTRGPAIPYRIMLGYGARAFPSVAGWLLLSRADQLILAAAAPARDLGLYAAAAALAALVLPFAAAFANLSFTRLAGPAGAPHQRQLVTRTIFQGTLVMVLVAVVIYVSTPLIVPALYGRSFLGTIDLAKLLLLASVPLGLTYIAADMLRGLGAPGLASMGTLVGAFGTIACLALFVPAHGAEGAALASVIGYGIAATCMLLLLVGRMLSPALSLERKG